MNQAQGEKPLNEKVFEESFAVWWPKLEEKLRALPASDTSVPEPRDQRSIQEETLETVRQTARMLAQLETRLDFVVHTVAAPLIPTPGLGPMASVIGTSVGGARVIGVGIAPVVSTAPGTERRSPVPSEKDDEKK